MTKLAFVFPGQGSQKVGMMSALLDVDAQATDLFQEASDVLGYDLLKLIQEGPEDQLNQTAYTQPAMLAADVAFWRFYQSKNNELPQLLAGHSLGEYSALVASGAIAFSDAITLVSKRGEFMQNAVAPGEGAMAAVLGLNAEQVASVCRAADAGGHVTPANLNAPEQIVMAGTAAAVDKAIELANEAGAKRVVKLPMSVPSHCLLMKPAAEQLAAYLNDVEISAPTIPVINNVDVAIANDSAAIKDALVRQLYNPVRWVETIEKIAADGVEKIVECGPGKVLMGMSRRIVKGVEFDSASSWI